MIYRTNIKSNNQSFDIIYYFVDNETCIDIDNLELCSDDESVITDSILKHNDGGIIKKSIDIFDASGNQIGDYEVILSWILLVSN